MYISVLHIKTSIQKNCVKPYGCATPENEPVTYLTI